MSTQTEAVSVADGALDQLACASECLAWIDSLAWAIGAAIKAGMPGHAAELASAAQHLASDCRGMINDQTDELHSRLEALDAEGGDE